MVSESSFCPDTALTVCECECVVVWVGGGNLFTAHTRCFESSRQGKKRQRTNQKLGRVKVQHTGGEFFQG